jgi:hypothetical protein
MPKLNSKYKELIQTLQLNPKFILGGSCALRLLDLLDRETEDIDINVTQALTLEDVNILVEQHGFTTPKIEVINQSTNELEIQPQPLSLLPNYHHIKLEKDGVVIDIFNHVELDNKVLGIDPKDQIMIIDGIKVLHPLLVIFFKTRSVLLKTSDNITYKGIEDLKTIFTNPDQLLKYKLC